MRRWTGAVAVLAVVFVLAVSPFGASSAVAAGLTGTAPLTLISVSDELNCQVRHEDDGLRNSWYPSGEEIGACGTFVALGEAMYGPSNVPAGGVQSTPWTPVTQTSWTGSGSAGDPYRLVTTVRGGDVTLVQTDTYVDGVESYDTSVTLTNDGGSPLSGQLYTGGDCYLQGSDASYGRVVGSSPACAAQQGVGGRVMQLVPRTGGNTYFQGSYSETWSAIDTRGPLPNTCQCDEIVDSGMAVAWPLSLPSGASATYEWTTLLSPTGAVPPTVSATTQTPTVGAGQNAAYTVTVNNPGTSPVAFASITVTLPAGFAYRTGSTGGLTTSDPAVSGQTLTWTFPFEIDEGESHSITFSAIAGPTPGVFPLDATAAAADASTIVTGIVGAAAVTVIPSTDLAITKVATEPTFVVGAGNGAFSVVVENRGPVAATNVVVSDIVPAGMSFVSADPSAGCAVSADTVRCELGTLPAGEQRALTLVFTLGPPGSHSNGAVVTSADIFDTDTSNNSATAHFDIAVQVDLSVVKTGPATADAGTTVTYESQISNAGPASADYTFTDVLPTGMTLVSIAGTGCVPTPAPRCTGTLAPDDATTVTVVATISPSQPATSSLVNRATVTTTQADTNAENDTSSVTTAVTRSADVSVTKSAEGPIVAGAIARWEVMVSNAGPSSASGVTVTDQLPPGATFDADSSSASCSASGAAVQCTSPDELPPDGAPVRFTIAARIAASTVAGTALPNTASVTAAEPDPVDGDNLFTLPGSAVRQVDLVVTKTAQAQVAPAGSDVSWDVTVHNRGPSDASAVEVVDAAPVGVTWTTAAVTGSVPAACDVADDGIDCAIPTLAAGDTATFTFTGRIGSGVAGGSSISNTVRADAAETELIGADNAATASVSVEVVTGLSLEKARTSAGAPTAGGPIEFELALSNAGPSVVPAGATISDPIPAGIESVVIGTSSAGLGCEIIGAVLSCTTTVPMPPESAALTVTMSGRLASGLAAGATITNTATAADATGGTATGAVTFSVIRSSTIVVTKAPGVTSVNAGEPLGWTITVENQGPSDVDGVTVTDLPDAGYTVTALTGAADCTVGAGCVIPTIVAGQSVTVGVEGIVSPTRVAGTMANGAAATNPNGGGTVTGSGTVTVTRAAALSIVKSGPATAAAGGTISYDLTMTNAGPSTSTSTTVEDTLPAGFTLVPGLSSDGCAGVTTVTCDVGTIGVDGSATVTVTAAIDPAVRGTVLNTATAQSAEGSAQSAVVSTEVAGIAALSIVKSVTQGVAGEDLVWTVSVANDGPSTAENVVLTDVLDPSLEFVSASVPGGDCGYDEGTRTVTCVIAVLGLATIDAQIRTGTPPDLVDPAVGFASIRNEAAVTSATFDPVSDDNVSTTDALLLAEVELVPAKTAPAELVSGTDGLFVIGVTNDGPSTATGVEVIDVLDPRYAFVPALSDPGCTLADAETNEVRCAVEAPLGPGDSASFEMTVRSAPWIGEGTVIANGAVATAQQPDLGGEVALTETSFSAIANLSIVKHVDSPVIAGEGATYSITVRNDGPSAATNLVVTDSPRPPELSGGLVAGTKGQFNCPVLGLAFRCVLPQVGPGTQFTIEVPVRTDAATPGGTEFENTATVLSDIHDEDMSDNASTATLTVLRHATLALTKTASLTAVRAGESVDWTLTVTNAGPSLAESVTIGDSLPAGLSLASVPNGCTAQGSSVTCDAGDLAPGASVSFVLTTRASGAVTGRIENVATAVAADADGASAAAIVTVTSAALPPTGASISQAAWLAAVLIALGAVGVGAGARRERSRVRG